MTEEEYNNPPGLKPGFENFNSYPHLCVDVPNGGFTISAKTEAGDRITFSFVPYRNGGPPRCVDVQTKFWGQDTTPNGEEDLPVQNIIVFGPGSDRFRSDPDRPPTLATFVLANIKTK